MANYNIFLFLIATLFHRGGLGRAVSDDIGTCSETQECVLGCCSDAGFCGFGPNYCGDSCISSCDAAAECGQYAATPGTKCPLNVCCSQSGLCGTTKEFCGEGCQSGCEEPEMPRCRPAAAQKRIGYYESWTMNRKCNVWEPFMIDATKWTHLNYAFALIDESTYEIGQMNSFDTKLYGKLTDLKFKNPTLKVYISVGGWSAGGAAFSAMASTKVNRAAFIQSTTKFIKTYVFDGVDISWQYPAAKDRGGEKADSENFVTFLSELRDALGDNYGLTVTLPSSYWYLKGFDIARMEQHVDWFNLMSHDMHGKWDGKNEFVPPVIQAHANVTEIKESLNLLWRNGINPNKVVLGLGFYGRSFTLKDTTCAEPGCPFSGGGDPGECTETAGILSFHEIRDIMKEKNLKPLLDEEAAVKYISWDGDQWVSYDDSQTFGMKLDYAKSRCLGGSAVWALDLDSVGLEEGIDSTRPLPRRFLSAYLGPWKGL
ncbi:family 18 glycosyl hydrolase [Ilyonectria robusta]|uniref:family 18 glycosyl hydrolase n=1 Tax=Ilyonectria robusta TaxID=1079257 RepID=UPI001E8DFA76|nr:family 18 glycosyl hydrolase [Ilyonectria robusta]KAH8680171.1 family 18 glycosyl hydrolase [Ilyonectria robusta]